MTSPVCPRVGPALLTLLFVLAVAPALATVDARPAVDGPATVYAAGFFDEYRPQTALDMVRLVPGFRIDNGGGGRGLGGAQGNVLIDGRRPGAKQDSVSAQLQRIPASRVERLVLLQPGTTAAGTEVDGRRTLLDVRLKPGSARAWTWSATIEQDTDSGGPTPSARLSMIDRFGATELRAGITAGTSHVGNRAGERIVGVDGPLEDRLESERFDNRWARINLNTVTSLDNGATLRTSAEFQRSDADDRLRSRRRPAGPNAEDALLRVLAGDTRRTRHELSATFGRALGEHWQARLIGLTRRNETLDFDGLDLGPLETADDDTLAPVRRSDTDAVATESILRSEWVWTGWAGHRMQFDLESAWNALDSELVLQAADPESGQLVAVPLPGSDTRVEEWRLDGRLSDRFDLAGLIVEPALGAEFSRIRQSGETGRDQTFTFLKPALSLIHAPSATARSRLRLERSVAQLDFGDFVSAADFDDDEVDFGNPSLGPQQTWIAELEHERRFGEIAVATLTAYHHWVEDLQDRLPIGGGLDVAGNIGDGQRWGLRLQTTLPLDRVGLQAGRVDMTARWEDSSITDPVTGIDRPFSWQRRYAVRTELRQDLVEDGWAWGIETDYADQARSFGADEINRHQDGLDVEAFIETTRFAGVKVRLMAQNLIDRPFERERLLFDGNRAPGASPTVREQRELRRDRSILLSVSGTF
ncbi:TonB-dependent receptor [Wenzhouxiangella sp. XN79A]|uniref:TonB-dependent receptor domain-containing protein n=1 Tax=Wenzhouxiangella sp. XN79A TaxID=2724193 RepID=UPI00144A5D8C|nr:TonB-dependent receptor [Wenzhouxiangella sp. XN79A]NKI34669.1 TonB-dependent receptor [Wenzhouxiangella sp. XN79A]